MAQLVCNFFAYKALKHPKMAENGAFIAFATIGPINSQIWSCYFKTDAFVWFKPIEKHLKTL